MYTNKWVRVKIIDYLQTSAPSIETGATFRLNDYMSRYRFEQILKHMKYTQKNQSVYEDNFFK